MTHLVFGTGLIGGFVAGGLLNAGIETVLLGRERQREAMKSGLTISDLNGNQAELDAPMFWQSGTETTFDIIWLTVKCTAVANCIDQLKTLITETSIIICCQNGFGSDHAIRTAFPNNTVLTAAVGFNVADQNSGHHLHRSTDGHLVVQAHPRLDGFISKINCELLPAHSATDIQAERWAKLQLNLANPVNALADVPTKTMVEDAEYRKVIVALMRELLSVTKAMGLDLPKLTAVPAKMLPTVMSLPNWLYLLLAQKTLAIDPTARVSMWWDLSQGKQSEIDYLNQAVVEQGRKLGIDCPYNERIVALIKQVEAGDMKIGLSGHKLQSAIDLA